jgi:hypothetical protein
VPEPNASSGAPDAINFINISTQKLEREKVAWKNEI